MGVITAADVLHANQAAFVDELVRRYNSHDALRGVCERLVETGKLMLHTRKLFKDGPSDKVYKEWKDADAAHQQALASANAVLGKERT